MTMTDNATDTRIREFTAGALAALTDAQRAECELFADAEPGMRLRQSDEHPDIAELMYGGAVIGSTTWTWLNTGETDDA